MIGAAEEEVVANVELVLLYYGECNSVKGKNVDTLYLFVVYKGTSGILFSVFL